MYLKLRVASSRLFRFRQRRLQSQPFIARRTKSDQSGQFEKQFAAIFQGKGGEKEKPHYVDEEPHMLPSEIAGGFHPLAVGQHLDIINPGPTVGNGTFEIVRKLGWGMYSSVWLVRSTGCAKITTQYQASKILNLNATAGILNDEFPEFDNLVTVTQKNPRHPGYHYCSFIIGRMVVESVHGPHYCFLFEPMGTDLAQLQSQQPSDAFPVSVTKRIIKQTLLALDYIHTECGLVHTDLKPANMLISLGNGVGDNMDETIKAFLQEHPSESYEPRIEPSVSAEPIITVKSQPLPNFGLREDLSNIRIKLIDFGVTRTREMCSVGIAVQPFALRAPEIILGHPWFTPVDIWSVGCLAFEYLVPATLFQNPGKPGDAGFTDIHLARMIEFLGPFPDDFLKACTLKEAYFDKTGTLSRVPKTLSTPIETLLNNYKRLKQEELAPAANFIRRCLTIDPSARPTAKELLEDEWLNDV